MTRTYFCNKVNTNILSLSSRKSNITINKICIYFILSFVIIYYKTRKYFWGKGSYSVLGGWSISLSRKGIMISLAWFCLLLSCVNLVTSIFLEGLAILHEEQKCLLLKHVNVHLECSWTVYIIRFAKLVICFYFRL